MTGQIDPAIKKKTAVQTCLTTKAEKLCGSQSDAHAYVRHLQKKEVL